MTGHGDLRNIVCGGAAKKTPPVAASMAANRGQDRWKGFRRSYRGKGLAMPSYSMRTDGMNPKGYCTYNENAYSNE
jgi:hypothetical protein